MRRGLAATARVLIATARVPLAAALMLLAAAPASALERLPGVLHVHSTLSTGALSLEDVAATAERQGIGALLVTENYLLRLEYGLPPFRALTRLTYEEHAVLPRLDQYLARVQEARARFPRMVIVPGVEVMPHYHWSGSPVSLELGLHDTQKNILVFGLRDAASLRALPAIGSPAAREVTVQSLVDLVPALLIVPGIVVLARPRPRRRRLGSAVIVVRRRRWMAGGILLAIGLLTLVRAWPFTVDRYPPWRSYGLDPHQAFIDEAERLGGAAVWSFPEAPDAGERHVGPMRVRWKTDPYPDDLLRTSGYTAFGAVYEQSTRFTRPGEGWDRLLTQYAAGERTRPVWGVGESGFHAARAGKRIGPIQTVFLVDDRSESGVLDALKRGRMYAVRHSGDARLVLAELRAVSAAATAGMGDTLAAAPGTPIEVRATLETADGKPHPVRVALVKNGEVVGTWSGAAPLRIVHRDAADSQRRYYRLEARVSASDYLLANPVFVAP
jgi:hypothetical protein